MYDSNEACGVRVGQDAFNDVHTISLAANQDLRQDGRRAAVVSLYADLLSFSEDQNAWVPVDLSFKLAEYNVSRSVPHLQWSCSKLFMLSSVVVMCMHGYVKLL